MGYESNERGGFFHPVSEVEIKSFETNFASEFLFGPAFGEGIFIPKSQRSKFTLHNVCTAPRTISKWILYFACKSKEKRFFLLNFSFDKSLVLSEKNV